MVGKRGTLWSHVFVESWAMIQTNKNRMSAKLERITADQAPPAFVAFMNAMASSPYAFSESQKCIVNTQTKRKISGVTTKLKRVLAAGLSAHDVKERKPMSGVGAGPSGISLNPDCKSGLPNAQQRCKGTGKAHGSLVDSELSRCAKSAYRHWPTILRNADPCTHAVLNSLTRDRLVPIAAQFAIGCAAMNMGTMIDLLCFIPPPDTPGASKHGQIIVVEHKCCFDLAKLRVSAGKMLAPFDDLDHSVLNEYYLQLLATLVIMEYEYGYIPDGACLNIVCPNHTPLRVGLPEEFTKPSMRLKMYETMCTYK